MRYEVGGWRLRRHASLSVLCDLRVKSLSCLSCVSWLTPGSIPRLGGDASPYPEPQTRVRRSMFGVQCSTFTLLRLAPCALIPSVRSATSALNLFRVFRGSLGSSGSRLGGDASPYLAVVPFGATMARVDLNALRAD